MDISSLQCVGLVLLVAFAFVSSASDTCPPEDAARGFVGRCGNDLHVVSPSTGTVFVDGVDVRAKADALEAEVHAMQANFLRHLTTVSSSTTGTTSDGAMGYHGPFAGESVTWTFPLAFVNDNVPDLPEADRCLKLTYRFFALGTWDGGNCGAPEDRFEVFIDGLVKASYGRAIEGNACGVHESCETDVLHPGVWATYTQDLPDPGNSVGIEGKCYLDAVLYAAMPTAGTKTSSVRFVSYSDEGVHNEGWIVRDDIAMSIDRCP
eukprot:m.280680 g.280680  ORF g.280680 m.280680 type:complete len:264 (-) comp19399_c11_seq1:38-829(-)